MKFILKWLLNGAIVTLLLMYYADVSFLNAFITASVLTIIAYVVGDQLILRATNNTIATLADFMLAFVLLWIAGESMNWEITLGEIFIISLLVAISEWMFHRFVLRGESVA
jgi:uncharacterized protein YebE (UPF0316 family)